MGDKFLRLRVRGVLAVAGALTCLGISGSALAALSHGTTPADAGRPHYVQLADLFGPSDEETAAAADAKQRDEAQDASIASLTRRVGDLESPLRHLPAHVELDDLVSEGAIGLIDAVRKFDPARGVTIETYARYRIRGAILDSLRDQDHPSRDMRRRIKKIESACQDLESQLGRPAGDGEMAEAMGLSLARWYERVAELQRLGFEGAGSRMSQQINKRVKEEDLPARPDIDSFTLCYHREQRDLLSSAMGCLTERERSIITFYYKDALTMKEIGSRLGIDESRVSQLHSGALLRLCSRVAAMLRRPAPGPDGLRGETFAAVGA